MAQLSPPRTNPTPLCVLQESHCGCRTPSLSLFCSLAVQMEREKWRWRNGSDQLKGNVTPSCGTSSSSQATIAAGAGSSSQLLPQGRFTPGRHQHCPGFWLGVPRGDSPPGGSSERFIIPSLCSSHLHLQYPRGQQEFSSTGGAQVCSRAVLSQLPAPALALPQPLGSSTAGIHSGTARCFPQLDSSCWALPHPLLLPVALPLLPEMGLVWRGKQMLLMVGIFPASVCAGDGWSHSAHLGAFPP